MGWEWWWGGASSPVSHIENASEHGVVDFTHPDSVSLSPQATNFSTVFVMEAVNYASCSPFINHGVIYST